MTTTTQRRRAKAADAEQTSLVETDACPTEPNTGGNDAIEQDQPADSEAAAPAENSEAGDIIQRRLTHAQQEDIARQHVLTEICHAHKGKFEPTTLNLTRAQRVILRDMGDKNVFEIIRRLVAHWGMLEDRAKFGRKETLETAKRALADAEEALAKSRAEIGDIEAVTGGGEPVLAAQIGKLKFRLDELRRTRDTAEAWLKQVIAGRQRVIARAPTFLKEEVQGEIDVVCTGHPAITRRNELVNNLHQLTNAKMFWLQENNMDEAHQHVPMRDRSYSCSDHRYVDAARILRPAIINQPASQYAKPSIGKSDLIAFMEWLVGTGKPQMEAELKRVEEEWQRTVDEISAPLYRWAETGQFD